MRLKPYFWYTSGILPVYFRYTSGILPVHFRYTCGTPVGVLRVIGCIFAIPKKQWLQSLIHNTTTVVLPTLVTLQIGCITTHVATASGGRVSQKGCKDYRRDVIDRMYNCNSTVFTFGHVTKFWPLIG